MKFLKNHLFTIIAFLIAIVFVGIILKDFKWNEIKNGLQSANYFYIIFVFLLTLLSYLFRAIRWNILFEPMGYSISNQSAFWSISLGYFFNLGIPRSGEIIRATYLYKLEHIPVEKSIASIVLERVVDFIFLLIFILLNLFLNFELFISFLNFGNFERFKNFHFLFYPFIVISISVILFILFKKQIQKNSIYNKINTIVISFIEGLQSIFKLKKRLHFILYSIGIWVCYFFMSYFTLMAFKETENISLQLSLFVLIAGAFGLIFPAAGGLGYPIALGFGFAAIYLSQNLPIAQGKELGIYYGILSYFFQVLAVLILGIYALFYVAKNKKIIK